MSQRLEDYEVLGIIGRGSSGTCYKVRNKFSKELYAWKAVDYGNLTEDQKQLLVSEVNLLSSLSHPNIVKYCGRILHRETTTLYIITEWCEGRDLSVLIKNTKQNGKYLEEQFIWRMLYQIGRAVQVCHSRLRHSTIFHRDIKPANVFLDSLGNAKLGDFGIARIVQPEKEFSETIVGTPYYMSPEVVKGNKYNRKSDIWALGCLIYELCALKPPFGGSNMLELAGTIKIGKYKSIPSQYSENIKKIISFMLSAKHEFRPTIEIILHHPSVVMNIKSDQELTTSRPSQSSGHTFIDNQAGKNLYNDLINLTLLDPKQTSHKVFKEKWTEKHVALIEKEAWLIKREKNIGHKEKTLANREKQLELLERKARQRQFLADLHLHRRIEKTTYENGHETDVSVEPGETPIRPTSTKLDPARLPKPGILINACKKLEKMNLTNAKGISTDISENIKGSNKPSNVRRSLLVNHSVTVEELKHKAGREETVNRDRGKDMLTLRYQKANLRPGSHCQEQEKMVKRHHEVMKELRMDQKVNINHEIMNKVAALSNDKDRFIQDSSIQTRKRGKLKFNHFDRNINKENIIQEMI